ncbi:hypothetical protein ACWD4Z_22790 [Streptomyces antibioticus]
MVSWPLERIGEAFIDGQWVGMPLRESTRVTISRGYNAEGNTLRPGSMTVKVNDRHGALSPRNAEGGLFEKWGRGTQFRFRVGDLPAQPALAMSDTFTRTVSNGWGTSTSGVPWVLYDPAGVSPPLSEFSVSSGAGKITTSTLNSNRIQITDGLDLSDFEALFTCSSNTVPQDTNTEEGIFLSAIGRLDPPTVTGYVFTVWLLPSTGLPGTAGQRVAVSINDAAGVLSTPLQQVPGLVYTANTALRVRVRCEGPNMRMRVWASGTTEPDHWHSQYYDERYTSGEFGFRGRINGDDTPVPVTLSFDDLEVRPLPARADVVRMTGEIDAIDPYEDENGDGFLDVTVAGALRRYDGPQKPVQSPLRRRIARYGPQAYWSFEEGAQGSSFVAQVGEQSQAGPLRVTGLEFARDSTLVGSAPLPTVRAGGTLRSGVISGETTGYWAVYVMLRLNTSDFPSDGVKYQMLSFSTATAVITLSAQLLGGLRRLVLDAVDASGASLGTTNISQDAALNQGRLGFLDRWQQVKIYGEPIGGGNINFVMALMDPDDVGILGVLGPMAISVDRVRTIGTTFGAGVRGMGIGHLSVWGVGFTKAYTFKDSGHLQSGELGVPGQLARNWLAMLAADEALALDVNGPGKMLFGPYPQSPVMDLVEAAASTDLGLLAETRERVGLEYATHETLYNRPVDLVLDYSSGMVWAPFKPRDDTKDFTNKIVVKRRAGSEATAELTEGRLSTQPFPVGIGEQDTTVETIVQHDSQLADQAGWRLHTATWDQMRVASITLKLAHPRLRGLLDTILALREGARMQVINTPRRYGPDGFDLLVRGSREVHGEGILDVTFNCVPYGPWVIGGRRWYEDFEDTTFALPYASGGNAAWTRSTAHFNSGTTSLRSGTISNNQTSDAIFTLPPGAKELRFWYWTSSEASGPGFLGDRLIVLVDGAQVLVAQGTTGWTQKTVDVTGKTTLTFRYAKDNSASSGEDAVHIDDISVTGVAPSRRDTAGSRLASDVSATATSLSVETTLGPVWTQDPTHCPFDARLGGEVVTVLSVTGATSPQTWNVRRSVNGVVKAQRAGTSIRLARPAVRAL